MILKPIERRHCRGCLGILLFTCLIHTVLAQETQIKGFADVQFGVVQNDNKSQSHGFGVGQYDLFTTSQIDDKTTFLAEVVFESHHQGETGLDIERIIIRRYVSDYLSVSAGKLHTPIGYWSNAYHHGTLVQPTINRPDAVKFEDDDGTLPIHQVGVQLDGSGITSAGFYYNVMVSNGLSKGNVNSGPYESPLAITLQAGIEPAENLKLFSSFYFNRVKTGASTYQGITVPANTNYQLLNLGISYIQKNVEFIGEAFGIATKMDTFGVRKSLSAFAYTSYTKHRLKPYVVFNYAHYPDDDRYFVPGTMVGGILGVRYTFSPTSVLKLELAGNSTHGYRSSTEGMVHSRGRSVSLQYCIGF